jgi:hypothetical protein
MGTYPPSILESAQRKRETWAKETVHIFLTGPSNGVSTILPKAERPEHQPTTSGPLKRPDGTIASSSNTASSLPNASTGNARGNSMFKTALRRCEGKSVDELRKTLSIHKSSSAPMPLWWPSNLETLSKEGNYHYSDIFLRSLQLTELACYVARLYLYRRNVRHKQALSSNCKQKAKLDTGSQSWPTTDESLQSPEENTHASTSASEYITISNEKSQMKTKSEPDTHKLEHIMRIMRANATGNELKAASTQKQCSGLVV